MIGARSLGVVPFASHNASYNMALDIHLLASCEQDPHRAFIRFYTWSPAALSLGLLEPADAVDRKRAAADGIDLIRRPTGGRVVLHKRDLTYTVVVPIGRQATVTEVYLYIAECMVAGLATLGARVELARGSIAGSTARRKPCFLSAARHEVVHSGRKLLGSAQRLGRGAVLQHGSLPIGRDYLLVVDYLDCGADERAALRDQMLEASTCLEDIVGRTLEPDRVASRLLDAFVAGFDGPVVPVPDCVPADPSADTTLRLGDSPLCRDNCT